MARMRVILTNDLPPSLFETKGPTAQIYPTKYYPNLNFRKNKFSKYLIYHKPKE